MHSEKKMCVFRAVRTEKVSAVRAEKTTTKQTNSKWGGGGGEAGVD